MCLFSPGCAVCQLKDVILSCPDNPWEDNTTIILTCTVSKAQFPKSCIGWTFSNTVSFRRSKDGFTSYDSNCTVNSASKGEACAPSSSATCWCDSSNTSHFVYKIRLTASTDYAGWWDCYTPCLDNSLLPALDHGNVKCRNIFISSKYFTMRIITFNRHLEHCQEGIELALQYYWTSYIEMSRFLEL
jgi:hypothetical protein